MRPFEFWRRKHAPAPPSRNLDRLIRSADKASFDFKGNERTFLSHYPSGGRGKGPLPLVMVLHGALANGENAMRMADLEGLADEEGFVVLYPDGSGRPGDRLFTWNAGRCCGYARDSEADDAGFLTALADDFVQKGVADPARIFVTGLSNGAMMAHRLACVSAHRVAAIAPVAGAWNCEEDRPAESVSVLSFHGTEDRFAPIEGGQGEKSHFGRHDRSRDESVRFWVDRNACAPHAATEVFGNIRVDRYAGGRFGAEVATVTIQGQGHAWPGGRSGRRYGNVDEPNQEISATEWIWEFFKRHPKSAQV